jgi:hypothetical protein
MTYDATLPTVRDQIRLIVGDTSDDAAVEFFPDDTYDATITANEDSWKLAAAAMAEAVAVKIEQSPGSLSSDGDSISWQDRTRSLRAVAAQYRKEAIADAASAAGITSVALSRDGVASGEYRTERYRGLWR